VRACVRVRVRVCVQCDGYALDLSSGPSMEGIALLNIPSMYGGSNLWGESAALKKRKKIASGASKDHDRECSSGSMSSADLSFTIQSESSGPKTFPVLSGPLSRAIAAA